MPSTNGHGSEASERVALYMRVSTEEQRDRETIEIQREFLEQYCRLYGLEIAEIYADDGVSGTVPLYERPDGRRLLEDVREDRFTAVLVSKLDRLGRSLLVIVDAHDRLDAAGATLRSGREPIDTSNPSGRLIFQMLASFAEYDRENIRERTQAGLHRAFRRGKHMGRIPYGYRANADAQLEVVEQEAEIVREIIGNIAGGSTLYAEAKRLNDSGVPAPGTRYGSGERKPGRLWQSKTLKHRPPESIHRCSLRKDQRRRGSHRARGADHPGEHEHQGQGRCRAFREQTLSQPQERPKIPASWPGEVRTLRLWLLWTCHVEQGQTLFLLLVYRKVA